MAVAREIERLEALRKAGSLTDAEFETAKAKALQAAAPAQARRGSGGVSWALWALVIVVAAGAAAALVMLDGMSRSMEIIAGCLGVVAAAAGTVMSAMEEFSIGGIVAFAVIGVAIGAVAFAALAPVLIIGALIVFPIALVWAWMGDIFGG